MKVPAFLKIEEMAHNDKMCIRAFFRRLVATKHVIQDMGQEASEEALEKLYNEGFLKLSMEPGANGDCVWRILLYDQMRGAYVITDQIKFETEIKL